MLRTTILFSVLILLLTNCSQPESKPEKKQVQLEQTPEEPKSASLFQNQKDRLNQIPLKNERKKDPKLDELLKTVEQAIKKKDLDLLLSVMDENIVSSEGGGLFGHEDFKLEWENRTQKLWEKLNQVVALGGTFTGERNYSAPYIGDAYHEVIKYDEMIVPYSYGITTKSNTKLYPNAKLNENEAVTIGRVYAIIDRNSNSYDSRRGFCKVNIVGTGIHGYVKSEDFYNAANRSLSIKKNQEDTWEITSFAGWD